eukprot:gene7921-12389_t
MLFLVYFLLVLSTNVLASGYSSKAYHDANCTQLATITRVSIPTDGNCGFYAVLGQYIKATCNSTHINAKLFKYSNCTGQTQHSEIALGTCVNKITTTCQYEPISVPTVAVSYQNDKNCSGDKEIFQLHYPIGGCTVNSAKSSSSISCNATTLLSKVFTNNNCSGEGKTTETPLTCSTVNNFSFGYKCYPNSSTIDVLNEASDKGSIEAHSILANLYLNTKEIQTDQKTILNHLKTAVEAGDAQAEYLLGYCHLNGKLVPKNEPLAYELIGKSAAKNNVNACEFLGDAAMMREKEDVAIEYYSIASDLGSDHSHRQLATIYYQKNDFEKSIPFAERCCESGNEDDLFRLQELYFRANKVENGWKVLEALCEMDYPFAYLTIALKYQDGESIEKNTKKAFEYFVKAAELGEPIAQSQAGIAYLTGLFGFPKDEEKAFEYFQMSANQDIPRGIHHLGFCYSQGSGVSVNYKKAFECYLRASKSEVPIPESLCDVGLCYLNGHGTEKNFDEGMKYLKKATEEGHFLSHVYIGKYYFSEKSDAEKLMYHLEIAAEHEIPEAQFHMGQAHFYGEYVEKDEKKSANYLIAAAETGFEEAIPLAVKCLSEGIGIEKDEKRAKNILNKLMENGYEDAMTLMDKYGVQYTKELLNK